MLLNIEMNTNSQLSKDMIAGMNKIIDGWNESKTRLTFAGDTAALETVFWGGIDFTLGELGGSGKDATDEEYEDMLLTLSEQVIDCVAYGEKVNRR